jgi:RND family efflux transporter MFP subunit
MRIPLIPTDARVALLLAAGALLGGCGGGRDAAAPAPPSATLESIAVEAGDGAAGRSWDGTVQAVRSAALSAQTAGRIERVEVDVDDRVAAGQVLLRITATEQGASAAAARADLRAAEAQAVEAEARFRRASELVDRQLVSRQDYEQAQAARDSAVAAREAAAAQLAQVGQQLAYTTVRAPFAGVVSRRHVEPGETVAPGQRLLDIHAPGALRIEAQVPEAEAQAIRSAPSARIRLRDGRSVDGSSVVVYPGADPASHSVTVRVQLPAVDDPPRPGETARVVFPMANAAAGGADIWVPAGALVRRGELVGVYVLQDGHILLRQLRVGRQEEGRVEVISGLAAGERIAADPVAALQALRDRSGNGNGNGHRE